MIVKIYKMKAHIFSGDQKTPLDVDPKTPILTIEKHCFGEEGPQPELLHEFREFVTKLVKGEFSEDEETYLYNVGNTVTVWHEDYKDIDVQARIVEGFIHTNKKGFLYVEIKAAGSEYMVQMFDSFVKGLIKGKYPGLSIKYEEVVIGALERREKMR